MKRCTNAPTPNCESHKNSVCWKSVLVACVINVVGKALKAALSHGVDQVAQKGLGHSNPLLLEREKQLSEVGRRRV